LTLSELSILLLPLDVANRAACAESVVISACNFALPMTDLWTAVYVAMLILIIFVIPFTLFYYEQVRVALPPQPLLVTLLVTPRVALLVTPPVTLTGVLATAT
jgi:hypothetical protein